MIFYVLCTTASEIHITQIVPHCLIYWKLMIYSILFLIIYKYIFTDILYYTKTKYIMHSNSSEQISLIVFFFFESWDQDLHHSKYRGSKPRYIWHVSSIKIGLQYLKAFDKNNITLFCIQSSFIHTAHFCARSGLRGRCGVRWIAILPLYNNGTLLWYIC